MVATYTTNKNLTKPGNNDNIDTWDVPVNANSDIIDKALAGVKAVSLSSSDVALTQTDAQSLRISLTGTLTANVNVTIPTGIAGFWLVNNQTTGAFTVTIKNVAGTGVTVSQGLRTIVFSDATNCYLADDRVTPPANNGITNALLAQMATLTIKSNITGGTANAADNTLSSILDAVIGSTRGLMFYRNATVWTALAASTADFVLTTQTAAADPVWKNPINLVIPSQTGKAKQQLVTDGTNPAFSANSVVTARCTVTVSGTTPTIEANPVNCGSVTRNGVGDYTVNYSSNLGSTEYQPQVTAGGLGTGYYITPTNRLVGSVRINFYNTATGGAQDPVGFYLTVHGGV